MVASLVLGLLVASGVVVESVAPGSAADKAGLEPGDRITSWSQGPDSGLVRTPFDLEDVEGERAPRGPVLLSASRGASTLSVSLGEEAWRIQARPELSEPVAALLDGARRAAGAGQNEEAGGTLADLAGKTHDEDPTIQSWFLVQSGEASTAAKRWEEAQRRYEAALAGLGPRDAAAVWVRRGNAHKAANSPEAAQHAYEEARRLIESTGEEGLRLAEILRLLILMPLDRRQALEMAHHAASLAEALAPDSLFLSRLWNNEAAIHYHVGDLELATALLQRAHALQKRKAPGSQLEGSSLINMGVFSMERGDLATAEESLRSATRILEALGNKGFLAAAYLDLGSVLRQRGDLDAALDATERGLEIAKDLPARGNALGTALASLGELARQRSDPARAEELALQAVSYFESVDRRWLATPLTTLGTLALARGDLDRADSYYRQALSAAGEKGSAPLELTDARIGLADVARARGDLAAAAAGYQAEADTHSKWRHGSFQEAEAWGRLASLQAEAGRTAEAAALWAKAVEALELQRQTLGAGQERGTARMAEYSRLYAEYVDVLLRLRRPEEAFRVVEASRARALVELLSRRQLGFARDIPPELNQERRRVKVSYDRLLAELDEADPAADPKGAESLAAQLRELQQARLRIAAEIRQAAPRLAEIENPRPASVAEARSALDPGTLLLCYLVGERKTVLFALDPGGIATFEIAAGREELREKIGAFLALLRNSSAEPAEITTAAEGLYRLLVAPAKSLVSASARILVSPDGPLQVLPFAALAQPGAQGRSSRFLAERLPIHMVASATLYAELRRERRDRPGAAAVSIAAFGDPVYPKGQQAPDEVALRSGVRGQSLNPLPGTGREAREIARLFPKRAKLFLGSEATEENAKALSPDTRYVHFGCHALLNARSPLDSGLVLSPPEGSTEGRENGILQAWEIFEDLRLDADIVTLSACESGLGADVAGEGLVGLTRAFQYAGARSVLASLWNVADDSTAELMAVFYRKLKEGKTKDRALQEAQVAMIRKGYSPFHWAAFQLTGDWR